MKLYTVCKGNQSVFKLNLADGVKPEEYSEADYRRFMETVKKHYVSRRFYWYSTDMSDSDSGTIYDSYPINQTNMVIKDNKLFGVLVTTRAMFPDYYFLDFKGAHAKAALGGGYSDLDYDWWIKEHDSENEAMLDVLAKYLLITERICYQNDKLSSYTRRVIGFMPDDAIVEGGNIVGFRNEDGDEIYEFMLSDRDSLVKRSTNVDGSYKTNYVRALVKVSPELLDANIFNVPYTSANQGGFEILDEKLDRFV